MYRVCGHCEKLVSEKTFKEHQSLFLNDHTWIKEGGEDHKSRSSSSMCFSGSHDESFLAEIDMNSSCCDTSSQANDIRGDDFMNEDHSPDHQGI